MKRLLALSFGLLLAPLASADSSSPLPAYTERTGSKVLFYFDSVPIDVGVKSLKVCTDLAPLRSLILWNPDLSRQIPARIGKHEAHCTEVTSLNFVAAGEWNLIAKLENGEQAWLTILVRDEPGL
jgi:hypothetical protein